MYVQRNIKERSRNHCCSGKAMSVIYGVSLCSQVSSTQCAYRILPFVACPAVKYFSTLCNKRQDFRMGRGELLEIKWVLIFSTNLSETFLVIDEFVMNDKTYQIQNFL